MQASPAPSTEGLATEAVTAAPAPLITGPVEMLWLLAVSTLVIMALVFVLLLRSRASRRGKLRRAETEFFKPAGEGADITFDDAGARLSDDPAIVEAAPAPKKKRGAFSGLFAQKERKAAIEPGAPAEIDFGASESADDSLASVKIERGGRFAERDAAETINARLEDEMAAEREAQRRAAEAVFAQRDVEARQRAAEAEVDRERREREARLFEEEDRRRRDAEFWQQRRIEEEARRPPPPPPAFAVNLASPPTRFAADPAGRFAPEDISRTLSEVEEAMSVQRESIQSETRALLDAFTQRLSARLDAIAAAVERAPAAGASAPSAALDGIARDIAIVRERLDRAAAVDPAALQQELALLRQAITGPRDAAAPAVQLADVIRNALPPGAYEMPASLSNSRRVDCLVKLPRPSGPIAIDARFPVEAFSMLRNTDARRGAEAESEFRRIAIRHVVDIAERLISPGETAESAIMFIPSEAMYSELHHRFADVVQDAWRARVWIVSPTTLLATLHTIQAAFAAAEPRAGASFLREDAGRSGAEMTDLRRRIAALEEVLASAQPGADPAPIARASAPPPARTAFHLSAVGRGVAAPPLRAGAGDRIGDLAGESSQIAEPQPARPLFPLR